MAQIGRKWPKTAEDGSTLPNMAQDGLKMASRWPQPATNQTHRQNTTNKQTHTQANQRYNHTNKQPNWKEKCKREAQWLAVSEREADDGVRGA